MITINELLGKHSWDELEKDVQFNLINHHHSVNAFRQRYNFPMYISSPVRTPADHSLVYKLLNEKRKGLGLPQIRIPWGSLHLRGAATDFSDPRGKIVNFARDHQEILLEFGLYIEHESFTPGWCHIQSLPPVSGTRFFEPY